MDADHHSSARLRVAGLTKRYGRLTALEDVSCTARPGEVVGLIGPNGAGKTTLLECVAGLLPRDAGVIDVDGWRLEPGHTSTNLLYLPDGVAPWPTESLRWVLDYVTGFFGGRSARAGEVVRELDLTPLLDQRIGTLSKGQRKRAVLAVGLVLPQPLLLIDEPFDGLDLRQTRELGATLRAHAATGRTLVLSIHQIADAARVCDRLILLSNGRVRGEGTLDELASLAAAHGRAEAGRDLEEVFLALT